MKIYQITGVIILATLLGLLIILYAASTSILLGGFARIEEEIAVQDCDRMVCALVDDITMLDAVVYEWASRDETRAYVSGYSSMGGFSHLNDRILERLGINVVLVVSGGGRILDSRGYDFGEGASIEVPESLKGHIGPGLPLSTHEGPDSTLTGIVMLPQGPMLVASRPVLAPVSDEVAGSFVMGRFFDDAEVTRISTMVSLPVELITTEVVLAHPEYDTIFRQSDLTSRPFIGRNEDDLVAVDAPVKIQPLGEKHLAGYSLVKDIYGSPALMMRTTLPRDIYTQGKVSTFYFLVFLLGGGLIIMVLIILTLERSVLSRLSFLSARVHAIGSRKDFSDRLSVDGDDEVSTLASAINGMLAELESTQLALHDRLYATEERYRVFFNTGTDALLVHGIRRDGTPGTFIEANEAACGQLGYFRHEMLRITPFELLAAGEEEKYPRIMRDLLDHEHSLYETVYTSYDGALIPMEVNAHLFEHMGDAAVLLVARNISERRETERLKFEAFKQIEKNMEQFAILNDHLRNPLQVIVGLTLLHLEDEQMAENILEQAGIINNIVHQLDRGWIESEKIRDWLRKYYEFD
ncbi:MAG TPA: PAS domain S-box protein [Methanoculleus sp.]|nr:PAS domain S-box protein [Methanoculleus sp.]